VGDRPGGTGIAAKSDCRWFDSCHQRSTAFGIFDTVFGAAWLLGSITFGLLYAAFLPVLVVISVVGQLASIPIFLYARSTAG
jgi:hypothetical protein